MSDISHNLPSTKNYRFRELKVYASTEWLADNRKKYRQVFDRFDTSYIYTELSFYNKLFDEDDWEIELELKCFVLKKEKKEICNLAFKRKVSKFDNVVYIREGWGNKKPGAFWKKGTYFWEVWVKNEKIATKYFYIEEAENRFLEEINPYVEIQSLKLYEGPYDDVPELERVYYKSYSEEDTRYIYSEIVLKNNNFNKAWQLELFIKFFNDARELKGQIVRLMKVEKKEELIRLTAGWGSNVKGSWRKEKYTVEIVFLDKLLAVIPFQVGDTFEEGVSGVMLPANQSTTMLVEVEEDTVPFEEVFDELDKLIGLHDVKRKVKEHAQYLQFLKLRKEKGYKESDEMLVHSVFTGNPGTGKTTVAKMMGKLYKKMGLLSRGHVHEVDRVDLVGEYIGQTAPKVREAIDKARGGVLFIDEAYALARSNDDSKDFGREVIEILVKEMSNGDGDLAVIVAGYPKEMKYFIDSNPGLKSRFKLYFDFTDYLPQELSVIADYAAREKHIKLSDAAKAKIDEKIVNAFRTRDKTFGNARFVFDLIEQAKMNLGLRIMEAKHPEQMPTEELAIVLPQDIDKISTTTNRILPNIPVDAGLLNSSLAELDSLIGMPEIKARIHELVRLVQFYKETGKNALNTFSLHTVFLGNPGTGKTTVARILTSIYKALGILERGHMIETDRQGLVAGYVGQTAIKTTEKLDDSLGGVLFIDEAYTLTMKGGSAHGDFGDEAVQTILKRMEDDRGLFFVFVAGYTENMENFLKSNPGLSSRFDQILKFEDYSPDELLEIALVMIKNENYHITDDAKDLLHEKIKNLHLYRDKYFGNARTVRQIIQELMKFQNLRMAGYSSEEYKNIDTNLINVDDINSLTVFGVKDIFEKKGIGFNK
ncbi:MAG TPA: AAA family ATPase [Saprospiraceae bacterium]|nr:AAA family ATPase [Saprospiraceae bacterium]HMV23219.1 AAA family ATPase [Saprospiraceae bacterium]HMX82059.1 AAA family ATPase [Saprospiraceae bacterium]HMX86005.1 AAA family ATPase [Saprospiraceae bacterium]HMZ73892.1 AAA family ATPase [Saprospiraceae bacterium]